MSSPSRDAMRADSVQISRLLKTARGQIDGILKMVEEDRYCIDISTQLLACQKVLQRANREVLLAHMQGCVEEAFQNGTQEQKLEEIVKLLDKLLK